MKLNSIQPAPLQIAAVPQRQRLGSEQIHARRVRHAARAVPV